MKYSLPKQGKARPAKRLSFDELELVHKTFDLTVRSNGVVEGQVNRLQLIKRMMYGRARFPLLLQRVLKAA